MLKKTTNIIIFLALFSAIAVIYFFSRAHTIKNNTQIDTNDIPEQNQPETVKTPEPDNSIAENKTEPTQEKPAPEEQPAQEIPEKHLLDMPFYSQAPFSNWDKIHEEMCEEASLLNAGMYLLGKKLSKDETEDEFAKMKKIEEKLFGNYKSTTASETKQFADVYFEGKLKVKIVDNPAIEQIETEIAAGNPVIVPLAGRDIGNPNFTPPGPVYHMLTIKGYDSQNFITNDVGTRKGNSYVYRKDVIMKNIHDWDEKDIHLGEKRALVLFR
jgi:hypothetical protein